MFGLNCFKCRSSESESESPRPTRVAKNGRHGNKLQSAWSTSAIVASETAVDDVIDNLSTTAVCDDSTTCDDCYLHQTPSRSLSPVCHVDSSAVGVTMWTVLYDDVIEHDWNKRFRHSTVLDTPRRHDPVTRSHVTASWNRQSLDSNVPNVGSATGHSSQRPYRHESTRVHDKLQADDSSSQDSSDIVISCCGRRQSPSTRRRLERGVERRRRDDMTSTGTVFVGVELIEWLQESFIDLRQRSAAINYVDELIQTGHITPVESSSRRQPFDDSKLYIMT